jgi:hypothetical protein
MSFIKSAALFVLVAKSFCLPQIAEMNALLPVDKRFFVMAGLYHIPPGRASVACFGLSKQMADRRPGARHLFLASVHKEKARCYCPFAV